ncbi:MAG: uroporphyrinogen-III decarboxylase [Bacteroidetes bacterium]|nr:uroporphyrinogen-III decarboxylase [Bacteroidota bacterium]
MTGKERVTTSLQFKEPDRVPFFYRDIPEVRKRLIDELQIENEETLFRELGIDFRWVAPEYTGPDLETPEEPKKKRSIWGIDYIYTEYSKNKGYWNPVVHPMAEWDDPSLLENYSWPDPDWFDFSKLESQCEDFSDFAVMPEPSFASPGILQSPIQPLVGDENSFMLPYLATDFFIALIKRVTDFNITLIERMLAAASGGLTFIRMGDDFGTQQSLLMSVEMWKEFYMPAYHRISSIIEKYDAVYYHHSCGAIYDLIPAFLKAGIKVLDPIQVSAVGMDLKKLKEEYGRRIVMSGAIDEAGALSAGTPLEVREEVFRVLDIMAPGGGYFMGPTHNLQPYIPTDNIVAMYRAAADYFA